MGIKNLLSWVKKTHPEVIVTYPSRWAAPQFKGKRVAIDATLLTNRYHFASRDGPFKDKGEIVGWYNLISEMRAYDVHPVAIWDQRGVREWKAPEARRRLMVRAGHLARRNHEIDRSSRLHSLREVLQDFSALPESEQNIVRAHWEMTRFMFVQPKEPALVEEWPEEAVAVESDTGAPSPLEEKLPPAAQERSSPSPLPNPPPPESITGGPNKSAQLVSVLSEADGAAIERITSTIDALAPLIQEYRESRRPASQDDELSQDNMAMTYGLENGVVEMEEELREAWPVQPTVKETEKVEELDETLADLVPSDRFTETPRQMSLTREEGEIMNEVLSRPASPFAKTGPASRCTETAESGSSGPLDTALASEVVAASAALDRLDRLIDTLPEVKQIYERALDIPSAADHEDCKELCRAMGVPVLEAKIPYEAEGLASALAKSGLVDYVGSEDSDVLAYEGPFLRHLSPATSPLAYIDGEALRTAIDLSETEYLDFLILLGTDASPRIPKIGPINALKLIRKHGSIEAILDDEPGVAERIVNREGFMEMINNARRVFTQLPPVVGVAKLEQGQWDEKEVERWLEERHGIKLVESEFTFESRSGE
ncbi:hypothetical protein IAU60_000760 [Kwoniella sp. DSM 27419]